jgi:flavorubredoxin
MISFDAFIVLQCMSVGDDWRAAAADRGVLDIDEKIDELMRAGAVDKSVDKSVDNFSGTEYAITKLIEDKLSTQITKFNCVKQCTKINKHKNNYINTKYSDSSTELISSTDNTDYSDKLSTLINRNTKMSNPAYRAVVVGDMPSRVDRAAQVYAEQLSAVDRPSFWKQYATLSENERTEFNRHAARLAYRGS